jgi:drug/metabolite transporter (DMT)-like permease
MVLEPFSAIVLAWVFLGETLRPVQWLGGVAVLAAATMIATQRQRA